MTNRLALQLRYDTIRYDTIRYDTIRYDTIRYDTIRYDTMNYRTRTSTARRSATTHTVRAVSKRDEIQKQQQQGSAAAAIRHNNNININNSNSDDHPEDFNFCSHHKHKDYQCDLIGIIILAIYAIFNLLQQETFVLVDPIPKSPITNTSSNTAKNSIQPKDRDENSVGINGTAVTTTVATAVATATARSGPAIGLPKQPQLPVQAAARRPSPPSLQYNHLDLQSKNGTLVTLIHIGKTGGSALRDVIDFAVRYCKTNYNYLDDNHDEQPPPPLAEGSLFQNAKHHEKTTLQKHMCALARITNSKKNNNDNGLIHLDRNLHKTISVNHFLVSIRNPVDRLVSWFHYEKHFQTIKQKRYSRALNELIDPSRCGFSTVNEVFLGKQQEKQQQSGMEERKIDITFEQEDTNPNSTNSTNSTNNNNNNNSIDNGTNTGLPKVATSEYCYKLSRDCLSGDIPCYGHNFFNYEYYLEEILVRVLQGVAASREAENMTGNNNGNTDKDTQLQEQSQTMQILPRVDVIRAEKSWDDLNRTLSEWTGLPMTPDMDLFYLNRKPFDVDTHTTDNNKEISAAAARSLCETICPELVTYTKIVKYAANLPLHEKTETLADLDTTCGVSVTEICGTSFRYRKIRDAKQSKLCEPRKRESGESESGGSETNRNTESGNNGGETNRRMRHRNLYYLREHDDLPSC
jgi:hypothetical protein